MPAVSFARPKARPLSPAASGPAPSGPAPSSPTPSWAPAAAAGRRVARLAVALGVAVPSVVTVGALAGTAHADESVPTNAGVSATLNNSPVGQHVLPYHHAVLSSVVRDAATGATLPDTRVQWFVKQPDGSWRYWKAAFTNSTGYARWDLAPAQTMTIQARVPASGLVTSEADSEAVTITVVQPPPVAAPSRGQQLVAAASREAGKPYVYGAAGPGSFDCSGFTMFVFREFGVSLPHYTVSQYNAVRHVAPSQMQPGDLVFIQSGGYIGHVGIYAGGGQMWHAPHSGDVVRLAPIYSSSFLVGRA